MNFGVFMHRADSIYDDSPAERYQFPPQYLTRASPFVGSWVIYLEPTKVKNSRGYFGVAKVEKIVRDPAQSDMYLALIEPGSYIDFVQYVPFSNVSGPIERGLLNDAGKLSGRAQAAIRSLSSTDFARIIKHGLPDSDILPRVDASIPSGRLQEDVIPFEYDFDRPVVETLVSRKKRDQFFRRAVLSAYENQCVMTGWKLINGGGRAEVEAAHIKAVEHNGPDSIQNGIALSGTAHWMFDRGLIGLSDDLEILIHRKVNDVDGIKSIINKSGKALSPRRTGQRPHPAFLQWHREHHRF